MASILELQLLFENLINSRNVYFQPPESVKIKYPAIIYVLDNIDNLHADNGVYSSYKRYLVTVIDQDPESPLVDIIANLPTCQFNRYYTSDNLNHWVFSLYF